MNKEKVIKRLNKLIEAEMSGVARYLHYSFMIFGHSRIPIVSYLRSQAQEGLTHATALGDKITALGGHPSISACGIAETLDKQKHSIDDILKEALAFEQSALSEYKKLLKDVDDDLGMRLFVEQMILEEQTHVEELEKMLREM
jgi:bacterioferritin